MPFPAGGADKVGNRYELRWTVRQFLRLLKDEAAWIHLEPIGADGDFIEFRLGRADGRVEAHQVKRQQAGRGHWTIADLDRVGVLDGVRRHAIDAGIDYVFVSTQGPKGLPELKLRAEAATDAVAFEAMRPPDLTGDLADFKSRLGQASVDQAWGALRRCRWATEDEETLGDTVLALLDAYVTGEPQAALGILALFALDSVHRRLAAADIWAELARHAIGPSDLARDQSLCARLRQCCDDYLQSQPFGFGDLVLRRAEAQEAATALLAPGRGIRRLFLTGAAGAGKSGVAAQVVEHMAALGWPVLPFRLDRLDPTCRPSEIGRQLLDRARSPVALLTGSADGRDCLLVIEQLDAVGMVSGRHPETFEAVAALVREAEAHPNLRLLLVCRAFDLDNDARLRDLARRDPDHTQTLTVAPLAGGQIRTVLTRLGQDQARLDDAQTRLLSLPLHLALLTEVLTGVPGQPFGFATAKDLYDAYWRRKYTDLRQVLNDPNAFEALLYRLCDAMNERQALTVPRGLLPPGDADLNCLVSAHVLVRQGIRLGFFHEGFFDYVFARRFCDQGAPLLGLLESGEQGLFCRSQVRQILVYRRDADLDAYLADLGACLGAPDLRPHLKRLMIGLIGQVTDPRPEEWDLLAAWFPERTGSPTDPVRAALWPSSVWFRFLHDHGVLSAWLASERPQTQAWAANWLGQMAAAESERVADLLEGLAGRSPEQDELVLRVASWHGAAAHSERTEALFHRLAAAPGRDAALTRGAYQRFIKTHCYGRGSETRVACRALGRWLALLAETPGGAEAFTRDQETRSVVPVHEYLELAKKAPGAFVGAVVGPFLRLAQLAAADGAGAPVSDRIWYGGFQGLTHWGPEALLLALVAALKAAALAEPECYSEAVSRLRVSDHRTAHAVLLRALAVEGGAWVEWALYYLVETWTRWGLWYDETALWDCRRLLQTLGPHLDAAQVAGLEPWILAHYEPWEPHQPSDTQDGLTLRRQAARWHWRELGQAQFRLLGALPADRLSAVARRRLAELSRKAESMGWTPGQEPRVRGGTFESPIPATASARMTDPQWRSAIGAYPDDQHEKWLEDRILGGARQLAGELEARTKAEPERFARLMLSLPEDTHEAYFEALIRGLSGGSLPLDLLVAVAERAHARPGRPHGRWLPAMIASHREAGLPPALLDLVAWYATQDPDPSAELWRPSTGTGTAYHGGSPYEHGINTARGSAAEAVAQLIAQGPEHWRHLAPTLDRMVDDPSIAVRTCVAEACTQALRHDRARAIALFLRLCNAGDALLASPPIERFLHYTAPHDFETVLPVLSAMLASPLAEARQAGARQVMVAVFSLDAARPWADRILTGDDPMRKGAAQILAANLLAAPDRAYVEAGLITLFHDPDPEVRGEAAEWTRPFQEAGRLGPLGGVADAFVASPAFSGEGIGSLFSALEEASDAPADLLLRAGERFVEVVGLGAGDAAGSGAFTAQTLSELVLRAYRQAEDAPDLRRRCLDLLDHLLEVGGYGTEEALDTLGR